MSAGLTVSGSEARHAEAAPTKSGSVLNEPRSAVEIAESIKSCCDLIRVADAQIDRATNDLSIAQLGLAEVELELTSRGLRSSEPESNGDERQAQ